MVAVRQTSVIFAAPLALPLLREPIDFRRTAGALATVAGVALIALWG